MHQNKDVIYIETDPSELYIDKDMVFRQIKCEKDNPLYDEYEKELNGLIPLLKKAIRPRAAFGLFSFPEEIQKSSVKPGTKVIYLITTLSGNISKLISSYFDSGDYVKGMLADAFASAALFDFEKPVLKKMREFCRDHHIGVKKRYEAPGHVPMQIQKIAFDALDAGSLLDLSISSGFMYDPVKSSCQVFETTENEKILHFTHGCSDCSNMDCVNRQEGISVKVRTRAGEYDISTVPGVNLFELLSENNISVSSPCGGAGRCGKCVIKVEEGNIEASPGNERFFTQEELDEGKRLACKSILKSSVTLTLEGEGEEELKALGSLDISGSEEGSPEGPGKSADKDTELGIAIDIGTTTLAFSLISLPEGNVLYTHTAINHQRKFGSDVITRIEAAGEGKDKELRLTIIEDLLEGIKKLLSGKEPPARIKALAIAANTTMLHLLMGYPAKSLGVYPFKTHTVKLEKYRFSDVFSDRAGEAFKAYEDIPVYLLPGISAYVGADIVSGLYSLDLHEKNELFALIDLGTNGEMALGNKEKLLVTSTAAGPAFEGGNIKYGTGSIAGAVSSVKIDKEGNSEIKTIGERPPIGICGTGVIEAVSELLRNEFIDETGALSDDYADEGFPLAKKEDGEFILLTQKDVREIQLAKSAIRAGFEVLLRRFGAGYEDISALYIAGGFGYYLDVKKACSIGMIPKELLDRTKAIGNSSLNGAVLFLKNLETSCEITTELAERAKEISLSNDSDFGELYMEHMMFE